MNPFLPDFIYNSISELKPDILAAQGVEVLLMDYDNTIVPYTRDVPTAEVMNWFSAMKAAKIKICVVSNSKKSRALKFCKKNGIKCITHARKPFQIGIRKAKKLYAAHSGHIAMVGDQIYTDILGANLGELTSILVRPIHLHNIWLKLRHVAELPWIAWRKRNRKK